MALLDSCFCCSLAMASGFFAVYLLIGYLIAFAFELLWILESPSALPAAAILLCVAYFCLALFAALLIHGLITRSTICLIAWMFAVTILTFPEAGMVIYMSVQYWRIDSLYGVTELACWFARIMANVIEIIVIQSLYTIWKDEEMVGKRLQDLSMTAIPVPRDSISHCYQNNAFDFPVVEPVNVGMKRVASNPHLLNYQLPNNLLPFPVEGYQYVTTQSEFNASIFLPNYINNDTQSIPVAKKTQSLMDLRYLEDTSSVILPPYPYTLGRKSPRLGTSSLQKCASLDGLDEGKSGSSYVIKNRTGFYAQPIANYGVPIYYGPLDGPDFLIYKKQMDRLNSKNSLSNASADDVQKYRDVVL